MLSKVMWGILIPFLGTSLGAGCVFLMRRQLHELVRRGLTGFAAGVMVAASVWSLLIPALEEAGAAGMGVWSFVPAAGGFWAGVLFLLALDHLIPHLHQNARRPEGPPARLPRITMMMLAVTLHNIPEGMAVGVVYAGYLTGAADISAAGALALSLGIAIQNFPEGAIVSMPLRAEGASRRMPLRMGCCPASWSRWPRCSPSWPPNWSCPPCPGCWPLQREPCCMWWWRNWCPRWPADSIRTLARWLLRRASPL